VKVKRPILSAGTRVAIPSPESPVSLGGYATVVVYKLTDLLPHAEEPA
jgi:hypothetical protein